MHNSELHNDFRLLRTLRNLYSFSSAKVRPRQRDLSLLVEKKEEEPSTNEAAPHLKSSEVQKEALFDEIKSLLNDF